MCPDGRLREPIKEPIQVNGAYICLADTPSTNTPCDSGGNGSAASEIYSYL